MTTAESPSTGRDERPPRPRLRRLGIALALAVLVFVLAQFVPVRELFLELKAWGESLGMLWPVLFVGAYVIAALLMVPGAVMTVLAGAFFGVVLGTVLVSVSATLVASLAFLLARRVAHESILAWAERHPRFAAFRDSMRRAGWRMVLLLRLSPVVPFSLSNYLYGLTGVRFLPYLWATWIGTLPGALLYVWIGALGARVATRDDSTLPAEWILLCVGVTATAVVTVYLSILARRALSGSRPEADRRGDAPTPRS